MKAYSFTFGFLFMLALLLLGEVPLLFLLGKVMGAISAEIRPALFEFAQRFGAPVNNQGVIMIRRRTGWSTTLSASLVVKPVPVNAERA